MSESHIMCSGSGINCELTGQTLKRTSTRDKTRLKKGTLNMSALYIVPGKVCRAVLPVAVDLASLFIFTPGVEAK